MVWIEADVSYNNYWIAPSYCDHVVTQSGKMQMWLNAIYIHRLSLYSRQCWPAVSHMQCGAVQWFRGGPASQGPSPHSSLLISLKKKTLDARGENVGNNYILLSTSFLS